MASVSSVVDGQTLSVIAGSGFATAIQSSLPLVINSNTANSQALSNRFSLTQPTSTITATGLVVDPTSTTTSLAADTTQNSDLPLGLGLGLGLGIPFLFTLAALIYLLFRNSSLKRRIMKRQICRGGPSFPTYPACDNIGMSQKQMG